MPLVDSTDGVRVAVHDLGGAGPDLLLAHATGFHAYVWAPMAAELVDRYHMIAVDYRGHGDATMRPDATFAWEGFRDDTLAVVDALDLDHPAGIGHSMGGAALLMAELARPGTFRALVLFEPIVPPPDRPVPEGGNPLVAGARRRRATFASRQEALENFAGKPPLNVLSPAALRAYVDHGFADTEDASVTLKCTGESEARTYEMAGSHATFARLGQVGCPVLVLAGQPEPFGPAAFAEPIAEAIPGGRFVRMEGVGHFGPMEDPGQMADMTAAFLGEHH